LSEHGRLSVPQVCSELNVSEATVGRDFGELAAQQLVTYAHGGVVATSVAYGLSARYKSAVADDNKQRIARGSTPSRSRDGGRFQRRNDDQCHRAPAGCPS
jgi:DeoR/GlpR family transcriptional regulator of sugar metabolism